MAVLKGIAYGLGIGLFFTIIEQIFPGLIGLAFMAGLLYIYFAKEKISKIQTDTNDAVKNIRNGDESMKKSQNMDIPSYLVSILPCDIYPSVKPFAQFLQFVVYGDGLNTEISLLTLISDKLTTPIEQVTPVDWYHLSLQVLVFRLHPAFRKAAVSARMLGLASDVELNCESSSDEEDVEGRSGLTKKLKMTNKKYTPQIAEIISDLLKYGMVEHFVSSMPSVDGIFKDLGHMLTRQALHHTMQEVMTILDKLTNILKKLVPRDDGENLSSFDVTSILVDTFGCVKDIWEVVDMLGGPVLTEITARQVVTFLIMWRADTTNNDKRVQLEARMRELVCICSTITSENVELMIEEYRDPESSIYDLEAVDLLIKLRDRIVASSDAVYGDFLDVVCPAAAVEGDCDPALAVDNVLRLLRNLWTLISGLYAEFSGPYVELCARTKGPTGLCVKDVFATGYSLCSRLYFLGMSSIFGTSRDVKIEITSVLFASLWSATPSSVNATESPATATVSSPFITSWLDLTTEMRSFFLSILDQYLAMKFGPECLSDERERVCASLEHIVRMLLFYGTRHCCYEVVFFYNVANRFVNCHREEIILALDKWNICLTSASTGNEQNYASMRALCEILWEISTTGQASVVVFMETFLSLSDNTLMSKLSADCLYCLNQFGRGVVNSLYKGNHSDLADEMTLAGSKSCLEAAAMRCIEIFQQSVHPTKPLSEESNLCNNLLEQQEDDQCTTDRVRAVSGFDSGARSQSDGEQLETRVQAHPSPIHTQPNVSPKQTVTEFVECIGALQTHISDVTSTFSVHSINANPDRFRFVLELLTPLKRLGASLHDTQRLTLEEHIVAEEKSFNYHRQIAARAMVPPKYQPLLKAFNGKWEQVRSENYEAYLGKCWCVFISFGHNFDV
jgi:hypothetical protein